MTGHHDCWVAANDGDDPAGHEKLTRLEEALQILFERSAKRSWNASLPPLTLIDISATPIGDLSIQFTSGWRLVVVVTGKGEAWRLLRPGDLRPHFVLET